MPDRTDSDGVPVVTLTADERGALRSYLAQMLFRNGECLQDSYFAIEGANPGAVENVREALPDVRFASTMIDRFGWDPAEQTTLRLDDDGRELLDRAVADARECLPADEGDHPDDVRGWEALVGLDDRVGYEDERIG